MKFKRNHPPAMHPAVGLVPFMSPKDKQAIINRAFIVTGGEEEYHNWIRENRGEYYTKHWLRDAPRPMLIENTSEDRIEILLKKARGDDAKVINGECTEVEGATVE